MTDLHAQASTVGPHLRKGDASKAQLDQLRVDLSEAADCIRSGDLLHK